MRGIEGQTPPTMSGVRDGAGVPGSGSEAPRPQLASGGHPDRRISAGDGRDPVPCGRFPYRGTVSRTSLRSVMCSTAYRGPSRVLPLSFTPP